MRTQYIQKPRFVYGYPEVLACIFSLTEARTGRYGLWRKEAFALSTLMTGLFWFALGGSVAFAFVVLGRAFGMSSA